MSNVKSMETEKIAEMITMYITRIWFGDKFGEV